MLAGNARHHQAEFSGLPPTNLGNRCDFGHNGQNYTHPTGNRMKTLLEKDANYGLGCLSDLARTEPV